VIKKNPFNPKFKTVESRKVLQNTRRKNHLQFVILKSKNDYGERRCVQIPKLFNTLPLEIRNASPSAPNLEKKTIKNGFTKPKKGYIFLNSKYLLD